jgi:hypothetical protein
MFANGTAKGRPEGGTPTHSPPLVPRSVPQHDHHVVAECVARVVGREIRKRREAALVRRPRRRPPFTAEAEGHGVQKAVSSTNVRLSASGRAAHATGRS